MFDRFITKRLSKIAKRRVIRECASCAYESDEASHCPKCNCDSFVVYYEGKKVA